MSFETALKLKFLTFLLALSTIGDAFGGSRVQNNRYISEGPLTLKALEEFKLALKDYPNISELEFVDSPGSHSDAGLVVSGFINAINRLKLNTFARGECFSSCAVIFLMGFERTLLPSRNVDKVTGTTLFLHPARDNESGEVWPEYTNSLNNMVSERSGGKISLEFLQTMFKAKAKGGGIYIIRKTKPNVPNAFFWSGNTSEKFEPIDHYTLDQLGIQFGDDVR
ncbi:hypothetical protein ACO0LD_31620 [Undibacterium sp. Ji83W]|uniref:hypothetical protein n=1 Tax=Undibacterium sp. Ji83W TaxID=3413043 RepID=UPI003BF426B9